MICLVGNLPVLQVGRYQVSGYQTQWIHTALQRAAKRAGQEEFPFLDEVYDGVVHYLEVKCSLRLLTLDDLYARVRHMLQRIGCESIAKALQPVAPPVTICLETAAIEAGDSFELAFFKNLQNELATLKKNGAREVYFGRLRESIHVLKQTEEWNEQCEDLEADILDWLNRIGTQPEKKDWRIRLSLGKTCTI